MPVLLCTWISKPTVAEYTKGYQIREKKEEEAEEKRKLMEEKTHQERVKEDAINRQIQAMRQKLKATKTEL